MARNPNADYQRALANQPRFSLLNTVRALSTGGLGPRDRDALLASGGDVVTPNSVTLPWGVLRRDVSTTAAGGQYLVSTATEAAHDALKPASVLVQAGCRVLAGLSSNVTIPRVTASATIHWLSSETTAATESQPTLAGAHMAPHTAAVYCEFSRQLAIQGVDFERMLRGDLLRVAGQAVDVGGLNGSGAGGQPRGILSASGIGSVSGSSLSLDDIMEMRKAVRDANGAEATTTWIAATDVADLLGQRERASGNGGFILDGGRIDGRPCIVSTSVPAGTLLLGDFSTVALAFWGPGLSVEVDPTANFAAGVSGARLMLAMDIVALTPAALCLASSVT